MLRQPGELPTYSSTLSLLNLAVVGIDAGAEDGEILDKIETARGLFSTTVPFDVGLLFCEVAEADLRLRQGRIGEARAAFERCLPLGMERIEELATFCLERLAAVGNGMSDDIQTPLNWATVFLVFALKNKNKLGIHHALKCLGDIFVAVGDDATAVGLFEVALAGFDFMSVHRRKGDCLVRIADIHERSGDIQKSIPLWTEAVPLFEKSLQSKDADRLKSKLAHLGERGA